MFNFKKIGYAFYPRRNINIFFKDIIIEISYIINSLKFDDIDQGIEKILSIVLKYLNADRSFLFIKWRTVDNRCSSYKYINSEFIINNDDSSTECEHAGFIKTLPKEEKSFVYNSNKKASKKIKEFYDNCKMKSGIVKQLIYQDQEQGFLTFDSVKNNKWKEDEFQILSLVSNMLINLIMKRRSDWESINAKKIIFEKLKSNEEEQRLILDNITDMVWKCDLEFNSLYMSHSAFNVTGYTFKESKNFTIYDTFTPKSIEIMHTTLNKYINKPIKELEDVIIKLELEHIHKDKHIFPIELIAKPVIENNKLVAIQGTIRDITQRKKWENELIYNQNLLSQIIDSAEVLIFIKSIDNKYLLTNKQHRKIFGEVKYGETDSYEIFSKEEAEQIDKNNHEVLKLKQNIRFEETTTVNGVKRIYLSIKFPVFDLNCKMYAIGCIATDITELKLFEIEINKLYTAIENSSSLVVITDLKGDIEYVNPKFNILTGYLKDEIIGKNPRILKSNKHDSKFYSKLWKIISSGKIWKGQICNQKKNGELFWESASIAPVFNGNKITNYIKISEDVTNRKQWEDKLIKSEKKFRALAENQYDVFWVVNDKLEYDYISPSCFRLSGHTIKEVLSNKPDIFYTKEEYSKLMNILAQRLQNQLNEQDAIIVESIMIKKDGTEFPVEITCIPQIIEGQFKGIQGITRDITERKEAEMSLKESEKRYRNIFDHTTSAVVVYKVINDENDELDFIFFDINKRCEEIEKIKRSSIKNLSIKKVFPGVIDTELIRIMKKVYKTGNPIQQDPIYYFDNRISGWRKNYVSKLSEDEIVCIYDDLTDEIKRETEKQLLQKQLLVSDKLNSIGILASGIAHNFNNISTVVLNSISKIYYKDKRIRDTYKDEFEKIFNTIESTKGLTKDLLSISEVNKKDNKCIYDINKILFDRCILFSDINKNIEIDIQYNNELLIQIDKDQINSVILNILINSSHAMNNKGKIIVTSEIIKKDEKDFIKISFQDFGCGMTDKIKDQIFNPFFTTKGNKGVGIGLSTVNKIINDHKGFINVNSEVNIGTTFEIFLPYNEDILITEIQENIEVIEGNDELIMIVDDEDIVLESIGCNLEIIKYRTVQFNNGFEAIKYYKDNWKKIDIVILDLVMPKISGIELYNELKEINNEIKAIMTTGFAKDKDIVTILENGCQGFINKPYNMGKISKLIDDIIKDKL